MSGLGRSSMLGVMMMAAVSGLGSAFGALRPASDKLGTHVSKQVMAKFRSPTWGRGKYRRPGKRGEPGDKLRRLAAEGRLSLPRGR